MRKVDKFFGMIIFLLVHFFLFFFSLVQILVDALCLRLREIAKI